MFNSAGKFHRGKFQKALDNSVIWYYNIIVAIREEETSMKQITVRVSEELFKELKIKLAQDGEKTQNYLVRLIKDDLGFTKEEDPEEYLKPKADKAE